MFITPYFGGCKYTNNFLFINKNTVFQHVGLLITPACLLPDIPSKSGLHVMLIYLSRSALSSCPIRSGISPSRPRNRKCNHRICDRQAEFGAFLCLTVPKTRVLSPKTGPTGRVSCKTLPDGREHDILWRKYRNCQGNFYTFVLYFMAFRERCGE